MSPQRLVVDDDAKKHGTFDDFVVLEQDDTPRKSGRVIRVTLALGALLLCATAAVLSFGGMSGAAPSVAMDSETVEDAAASWISTVAANNMDNTGWQNGAEKAGWVFNGMSGYHNNGMEDRVYNMIRTKLSWGNSQGWTSTTNWDSTFTLNCPTNQAFVGMRSVHNHYYEDRRFRFHCATITGIPGVSAPNGYSISYGGWTGWMNNWDGTFSQSCGNQRKVMVSVQATHNNHREDRRWKMKCGTVTPKAVNCAWGGWSGWSSCSRSCGGGTKSRSRGHARSAQHGGHGCSGSSSESTTCNTHPCPVHCNWSGWGAWNQCNGGRCSSTARGHQQRYRTPSRSSRMGLHGGRNCDGSNSDQRACNTHYCPINCAVGRWTGWSGCSKSCNTGHSKRTRPITTNAQHGGIPCRPTTHTGGSGPHLEERKKCNTHRCPCSAFGGSNSNRLKSASYCSGKRDATANIYDSWVSNHDLNHKWRLGTAPNVAANTAKCTINANSCQAGYALLGSVTDFSNTPINAETHNSRLITCRVPNRASKSGAAFNVLPRCRQKTCQCSAGTGSAAKGTACNTHGDAKCTTCKAAYFKTTGARCAKDFKFSSKPSSFVQHNCCAWKVCTCDNGKGSPDKWGRPNRAGGSEGAECAVEGEPDCRACKAGFKKVTNNRGRQDCLKMCGSIPSNQRSKVMYKKGFGVTGLWPSTVKNGKQTLATHETCVEPRCGPVPSSDKEFAPNKTAMSRASDGACFRTKVCTCKGGTPVQSSKCPSDGTHRCRSCDSPLHFVDPTSKRCTPWLCAAPATPAGYGISHKSLVRETFEVVAWCKTGYTGKPVVTPCGTRNGRYSVTGCLVDSDKDSVPDVYDKCPKDPLKTDPAACGCGKKDVAADGNLACASPTRLASPAMFKAIAAKQKAFAVAVVADTAAEAKARAQYQSSLAGTADQASKSATSDYTKASAGMVDADSGVAFQHHRMHQANKDLESAQAALDKSEQALMADVLGGKTPGRQKATQAAIDFNTAWVKAARAHQVSVAGDLKNALPVGPPLAIKLTKATKKYASATRYPVNEKFYDAITSETKTSAQSAAFLRQQVQNFADCQVQGCTPAETTAANKPSAPACAKAKAASCAANAKLHTLFDQGLAAVKQQFGQKAKTAKTERTGLQKKLKQQVTLMKKHESNDAKVMQYQKLVSATEKSIAVKTDEYETANMYVAAAKAYENDRNLVKNMYAMDPGLCCTGVGAFTNKALKAAFSSARATYENNARELKKRPRVGDTETRALALRSAMAKMKAAAAADPGVQALYKRMPKNRLLVEQALTTIGGNTFKPLRTAEFAQVSAEFRSEDALDQMAGLLQAKVFSTSGAAAAFNTKRAAYQRALANLKRALADKTTTGAQHDALARTVVALRRAMRVALKSDQGAQKAMAALSTSVDEMTGRLCKTGSAAVGKAGVDLKRLRGKSANDCRTADGTLQSVIKSMKEQVKQNSPFYTIDENGALVLKNWQVAPGLVTPEQPTTTSYAGTGTMTSASFVAKGNTLAFTVGGGDKDTTVVLQVLRDFSGAVEVRKYVGEGSNNREIFWDISEYSQDMLRIIVSDQSVTAGIHFSNVRMYDDATVSCVPDCLKIKTSVHKTFDKSFAAFDIMGSTYAAGDTRDAIAEGKRVQYCRVSDSGIARSGGVSLKALKIAPLKSEIRGNLSLPPCVHVEPYRGGYVISIGEDPRRQFLFSKKHNKAKVPGLMCIYPTLQPRCAEYSGVVKNRRAFKLNCVTKHVNPNCFESIYESMCENKKYCGEKKQQQDMLTCCDKHKHDDGHVCHANSNRRLSAAATAMKFKDFSLEGDVVRKCADSCMRNKRCVAWNVEKVTGMCTLTEGCTTAPTQGTEEFEWMVLPGVSKEKLFKNAKVGADGRIMIQKEVWSPN